MIITLFRKNRFSFFGKKSRGCCMCFVALLLWPAALMAQNGINISNFAMNSGTVTFDITWKTVDMPAVWSDSAWVFIDYNDAGVMKHLPLSAGATLTATSAPGVARVIEVPGNTDGVWVVGNARSAGSFSATVKLLNAIANFSGACAYASNYQPVGEFISTTDVKFTGSPTYKVVIEDTGGRTEIRRSDSPFTIPSGYTLKSFSDATGAPGIIKCMPPVITAHPRSQAFCKAMPTIMLSVTASGSGSMLSYQWKTGAGTGNNVGSDSNTYTGMVPAPTDYWVEVTDNNNCTTASNKATIMFFSSGIIGMKSVCGSGAGRIGW
jgi:hypothetical protein